MSQMDRKNAAARIEDTAWTSVLREDTIRMANELAEKVDAIRDAGTTVYPPRKCVPCIGSNAAGEGILRHRGAGPVF